MEMESSRITLKTGLISMQRLEKLWRKEAYTYAQRTIPSCHPYRLEFAKLILSLRPESVLEVGTNNFFNLEAIHSLDKNVKLYGCDIAYFQPPPYIEFKTCPATNLPYPTSYVDVSFTHGLLMHMPPEDVKQTIAELVRVSSKYIVVREDDEILGDGSYRGEPNALFIHDYQALFSKCKTVHSDVSTHLGYVKRFTGVFKK